MSWQDLVGYSTGIVSFILLVFLVLLVFTCQSSGKYRNINLFFDYISLTKVRKKGDGRVVTNEELRQDLSRVAKHVDDYEFFDVLHEEWKPLQIFYQRIGYDFDAQ